MLYDPVWQVMLCNSAMVSYKELYTPPLINSKKKFSEDVIFVC